PEHVQAMAKLCRQADYILPNLTEASLLTGIPYRETVDVEYLRELAAGMLEFGPEAVIITGFTRPDGQTGFFGARKDGSFFSYGAQRIPKHFHGTGDLFAAVFTGGLLGGKSAQDAATRAARFVERVIGATEESSPYGIAFEPELPYLWNEE
ncbi:MAG: bifunctional hydroxymethylpyrimidine kinase/phosphomethylpyrimidine kinase, partial [Lentisphaeria bacterium]|nr:bifunctional hydroxymethylpyrimidine kinase/phosphomethylpyrimidine kinase [Lentisphaeria bacterium]